MSKKDTAIAPVEGEIVAPERNVAVMLTPKQLRTQMQRDQEMRQIINEYISANMVEGKDYGSIEVKKGSGVMSKPSLLKPGAEKFCGLFKLRPTFRMDGETFEMMGSTPGVIAYICELIDTKGRIMGEGRGTAKADPKGGDFDINKQVKIAQKRAQTDAVLRTGGLSDFFTQDIEDMPRDGAADVSNEPINTAEMIVDFGKHKGTPWPDVPQDYLEWLAGSDGAKSAIAKLELERRAEFVADDYGPEGDKDHPDLTTPQGDAMAYEAEERYNNRDENIADENRPF